VLKMSHNELSEGSCICALGFFKQERATEELHSFLKSKIEIERFYAAQTLAERKDEAAIDVLAAVAADSKSSSTLRTYACRTLANFPHDPRVVPAIRICLDDIHCRDEARDALKRIEELQKK
jgi:PBS lyase HEAT-like repeat-containing protein